MVPPSLKKLFIFNDCTFDSAWILGKCERYHFFITFGFLLFPHKKPFEVVFFLQQVFTESPRTKSKFTGGNYNLDFFHYFLSIFQVFTEL